MLLGPVHTPESVYFWNRILFLYESASCPHEPSEPWTLACVATVSARVRRESWDESKKMEWRERGRGEKEVTSSSLPFPVPFFFRSRSNPIGNACHAGYLHIETAYLWNRSPGWVFFLSDGFGEFMWIFFFIRRVWRIHVDFFFIRRVWRIHVELRHKLEPPSWFFTIFFYG